MPLKYPAKGGKEFEKVPAGLHVAVCYLVADVGLQPGSAAFPDPKRKVRLQFEIPGETVTYEKDGKEVVGPMTIGAFFTASMNAKAILRKSLESWRGKKFSDAEAEQFDIARILGKPCQIQVMHTDDGQYANIANVLPPPKSCKEKATNKLVFYSTEEDAQFADLPKWLQEKVENQLDPAPAAPKTGPTPTSGSTRTTSSRTDPDEQEASHAAAKAAQKEPVGEFIDDSEIPF